MKRAALLLVCLLPLLASCAGGSTSPSSWDIDSEKKKNCERNAWNQALDAEFDFRFSSMGGRARDMTLPGHAPYPPFNAGAAERNYYTSCLHKQGIYR